VQLNEGWRMIGHHTGPVPPIKNGQKMSRTASAATRDRSKLH